MLISFNPYMTNTRSKMQSPNFKGKDINPSKIAENTATARQLISAIHDKLVEASIKNFEAIDEGIKIASKDEYNGESIIDFLIEAKEKMLKVNPQLKEYLKK